MVKICGLTNCRDLKVAAEAGSDAVGFVVEAPKSPRNLPIKKAKELIEETPSSIARVAVTVFSSEEVLKRILIELNPDYIQVHGGETSTLLDFKRDYGSFPCVRAMTTECLGSESELQMASSFEAVMLDSSETDGYGGTGKTIPWEKAKIFRERLDKVPLILSGGLNPQNVRDAIKTVRPYGVDVASGVEMKPGKKDPIKMRKFIAEAKRDN